MSLSGLWPPSRPYTLHLKHHTLNVDRGYIQGLTFLTNTKRPKPRCHYFGGVPYGLPPTGSHRFCRPRPLLSDHTYGTADDPTIFIGEVGVCPQPSDFGFPPEAHEIKDWNEDCLQSNIWVPIGEPPEGGWPVIFFLHGGYLSFGSPNGSDYIGMFDTPAQCILVLPGYRVNVFGFLAGEELEEAQGSAGNYGFWDQRMALEWVREWIPYFGGNLNNMTVEGYSAGALSVFHQLNYEFSLPKDQRMIHRIVMYANGPGIQPPTVTDRQEQFNEILVALNIPLTLSSKQKLTRLRSKFTVDLITASLQIPHHEFRPVTDNAFIPPSLFSSIENGSFVKQLIENDVDLLICECEHEHFAFATWHTPTLNTLAAVKQRLGIEYPPSIINTLCDEIYSPTGELPCIRGHQCKDWKEFFGILYADIQVHCLQRGFIHELFRHGAGDRVRRCKVGWRAKRADKNFPREMGATHGVDTALWFWGDGVGLELLKREEGVVERWCKPYWSWVAGRGWEGWEAGREREMRYIDAAENIEIVEDEDWERGLEIWRVARRMQRSEGS